MSDVKLNSPLSTRRMIHVGLENSRSDKELEKELNNLEKERLAKLRELNQESKRFRVSSARSLSPSRRAMSPSRSDASPSSSPTRTIDCTFRPVSSNVSVRGQKIGPQSNRTRPSLTRSVSHDQRELSPSRLPAMQSRGSNLLSRSPSPASYSSESPKSSRTSSPRQSFCKAISIDNSEISSKSSPKTSPEAQKRLLPKRNTPEKAEPSVSVTSTTITIIHKDDDEPSSQRRGSVFDIRDKCPSPKPAHQCNTQASSAATTITPIPQIVISDDPTSPTAVTTEDSDDSNVQSLPVTPAHQANPSSPVTETKNISLAVPIRRSRSSSVPSLPPPTAYLKSVAKQESTFTTAVEDEPPLIRRRQRSRSVCVPYFSYLKDSPRRESLLKKYTARRGSYRRTSVTIDHIISDLAKGICHPEFNPRDSKEKPISPEEWEKLKKCRYLRMPNREENERNSFKTHKYVKIL